MGWREALCLVIDPRMRGRDGGWEDAQAGAVRRRMCMEEERCTALGCEIRDVDMNCHCGFVISLRLAVRIDVGTRREEGRSTYRVGNPRIARSAVQGHGRRDSWLSMRVREG